VLLPLQLIDGYNNIIAEALKVKQGSLILDIYSILCCSCYFWRFSESASLVKIDTVQKTMRQAVFMNEYFTRKYVDSMVVNPDSQ